jgi:hypothetical protein
MGIAQEIVGVGSMVSALMLYLNILEIQVIFDVPSELLPLYLLILTTFSLFSVISGSYLIHEGLE